MKSGNPHLAIGPSRSDPIEPFTEFIKPDFLYRHSCRARMPTELLKKIPASRQSLIQVEVADGTGRASSNSLVVDSHDHRRPLEPFDQSRCNNPDDADVPAARGQDQRS